MADGPSPVTTPTTPRPQSTRLSSGYFAARPVSPTMNPRRPTEGRTRFAHPENVRDDSLSSSYRARSHVSELENERERGIASEDDANSISGREQTDTGEDDDVPSPSPEDLQALQTSREFTDEDPLTLKDRQSLLNAEHPFGLPIWKPALYKKSRTVTRNAETALHSTPGVGADRHLNFGNVLWTLLFGWWLALIFVALSAPIFAMESLLDGRRHASIVFGLGWYLLFPFGKYVEGDNDVLGQAATDRNDDTSDDEERDDEDVSTPTQSPTLHSHSLGGQNASLRNTVRPSRTARLNAESDLWNGSMNERTSLGPGLVQSYRSYGAVPLRSFSASRIEPNSVTSHIGLRAAQTLFWVSLILIITPLMLVACLACWGLVFTIPMAKLTWELLGHLYAHPLALRFRSPPPFTLVAQRQVSEDGTVTPDANYTMKRTRLSAGLPAPSGRPRSVVLLCIYKAVGSQYYKYTVGGVNILFVNTLPSVFLVILDGFFLLPWVENREAAGIHVPVFAEVLANRGLIFLCSLTSVIPLSYFIGMAVASISAQSSIGMGAVINATFGSVIEIILYSIALTESKGLLVEGSIVGSILAGVLLMPGLSMISSAAKRKESKFNAKSAGVTSTMLVMAMIGTLAPTLFYQTYGNFELVCEGCPTPYPRFDDNSALIMEGTQNAPWRCRQCYYEHPNPVNDPFYQETVKPFMYYCAGILLLSYLIGLWFSLRTHASQIWQDPQRLMKQVDGANSSQLPRRMSFYQRLFPNPNSSGLPTHRTSTTADRPPKLKRKSSIRSSTSIQSVPSVSQELPVQVASIETSGGPRFQHSLYTPIIESVDQAVRNTTGGAPVLQLPQPISTEDFARVVTAATVSALAQNAPALSHAREHRGLERHDQESGGHGGHGGPSWSRVTSASVLLSCTILYALIAEILVDVVDVVLDGSGIPEKVLGITLFALVPNTTEFMNAMSFAINGNISLSMEIGSAYALQVCLLQIPAMVAFSAWWDPQRMGLKFDTFTLIFPRWDIIAIILSIFLLTYTYIEAKSNYHRGSTLVLSYLVLVAGFFFAPAKQADAELLRYVQPSETTYPGKLSKFNLIVNSLFRP